MADKIIFDYTEDTTPARTDNVLLQPGISDVYTRAQIANILGTLIAADIPDISATYALVSSLADYLDKTTYDSNDDGVLDISTIPDISATYATQSDISTLASKAGQTFSTSVFIEAPEDKDYKLIVNLPKSITITKVTTICVSGTATATVKINSTALGGTANSVSSTEDAQTHSTSNVASAGDDIVLTISANSSCTDMSLTIEYTMELE